MAELVELEPQDTQLVVLVVDLLQIEMVKVVVELVQQLQLMEHLQEELEVVEEDFLLNQLYLPLVILLLVEQVVVKVDPQVIQITMEQTTLVVVELDHLNLIQELVDLVVQV